MVTRRAPDKTGIAQAWSIRINPELKAAHVREWGYEDTGVCQWYVHGPYHPLWSWWMVACVSLRDIPGMPPAKKQYPGAEFEIMIMSINPEDCDPDFEAIERGDFAHNGYKGFLEPPDMVFQCDGISEGQARALVETMIDHIVAGQSCDSDFRSWWENTLSTTVQHLKLGIHDDVSA